MKSSYELLIVGGGIYGASLLRDAAQRGIDALLVERAEFGGATSHNSYKIIHGGIRYLQHFDIPRVLECIRETDTWLRIAPHLVKPLKFVIPSYERGMRSHIVMGAGAMLHDVIRRVVGSGMPRGGIMTKKAAREAFPFLDPQGLRGAAFWHDAQLDNANQLIYETIDDARAHGGEARSYCAAEELLREGGPVAGARIQDLRDDSLREVRAKVVVNATGPWLKTLLPSDLAQQRPLDRHFFGMNLVIDQLTADAAIGLQSPEPNDGVLDDAGRLLFIAPWKNTSIVGTSHTAYVGDPERRDLTAADLDGFLETVNATFPFLKLRRSDVHYVYRGLTPADGSDESLVRSRQYGIVDHAREDDLDGLISVLGVKLTSARYIAEKTLNLVEGKLGRAPTRCRTATTPLPGASSTSSVTRSVQEEVGEQLDERGTLSLYDLVTCGTEAAELGRLDYADLDSIATRMGETLAWSPAKRDAELAGAASRLRIDAPATGSSGDGSA